MWLSKRIVQETPEFEPATLGTVSIGGEDAAVVTDGEKRNARVISPGGYCWQPSASDSVLVIKRTELYVPDGFGSFVRLQEEEALLERALFKLTCRRGAFPFLPELGSRLRELGRLRPSARNAAAQQYAAQALEGMGMEVTCARVRMVSDDQADVAIELVYDGAQRTVEVTV